MPAEPGTAVMIGEPLAASEELLPGPGTFDDGADIRAARVGVFDIDPEEFAAVVKPITKTPVVLKPGDIVIGEVYIVKESMTGIRVVARADAPGRAVSGDTEGTLHVAQMADRYVSSMEDEFKKGDIVRAKVIQAQPSVQLNTKGREFGVIKARSTRSREELVRVKGALAPRSMDPEDPETKPFLEYRYIAEDYGFGSLMPDEGHMVERDLRPPPRRDTGGGRGGYRGGGGGRGGPRGGGGGRGGPRGGGDRGGRGGDRGGRGGDRGGRGGGGGRGRGDGDRGGRGGDRGGRGGGGGGGRGRGPGGGGGDRGSGGRGRSGGGGGGGGGRGPSRSRSD